MASETLTRSYNDIIQAAESFYGQDYWQNRYNTYISQGIDAGQTIKDMYNELEAAGEITALRNQNGDVMMWYSNATASTAPVNTPGYDLNSNIGTGTASQQNTASLNIPMQTEKNPTTGKMETKPVQTFTNGLPDANSLKMVAGNTVQAIGAVATGITAGKALAQRAYDANPDLWDSIGFQSVNPETWKTLTSDMGPVGKTAVNFLLGFKDDDTAQPYMNDELFAYYMYCMAHAGVFKTDDGGQYTPPAGLTVDPPFSVSEYVPTPPTTIHVPTSDATAPDYLPQYEKEILGLSADAHLVTYQLRNGTKRVNAFSFEPNQTVTIRYRYRTSKKPNPPWDDPVTHTLSIKTSIEVNGETFTAYMSDNIGSSDNLYGDVELPMCNSYPSPAASGTYSDFKFLAYLAYIVKYGTYTAPSSIDGITDQDGATLPNTSNWDTPENTLQSLKNQYPNLWDNRAEQNVYDPDTDTTKKITYIPVGFPNGGTGDQPTNDPSKQGGSQSQPTVNPNPNVPDSTPDPTILTLILSLTDRLENALKNPTPMTNPEADPSPDNPVPDGNITLNPDPNPPDTGDGKTPTILPPTGNASSLWKVYHPSQAQVDAFGAWLWSSNFVEQIKKMFNDPMQSIIGLHKIFAAPIDAGTATIKVGYLDSEVASAYVNDQYVTVDCGSVTLREYFGNVFDYEPHTKVAIFLPFIGIQKLDVAEVMRSTISVIYHVDVFSGACLAEVAVTRDGGGGCLYTFSGDASARYPISSGSYMGIVSGVLSIAGGIAGTIATGGAALPAVVGAGVAATHMHTDVKHSGQISGNAGAMGGKKPYLIVVRPQTSVAERSEKYYGYGANSYCKVESLSGFARLYNAVVRPNDSITDEERKEIQTILESGFYA